MNLRNLLRIWLVSARAMLAGVPRHDVAYIIEHCDSEEETLDALEVAIKERRRGRRW